MLDLISLAFFQGPVAGTLSPGAGVDSAWEQEKPEARKMPEMALNPQRPVHYPGDRPGRCVGQRS